MNKSIKQTEPDDSGKTKFLHIIFQSFVLISLIILFSAQSEPVNSSTSANYVGNIGRPSTIDEISTTRLASTVAKKTELLVANNVTNLADTIKARDEFVSESSEYIQTPTIIATNIKTIDDLLTHTVQSGETLSSIAAKYGIKTTTIRWSNNLLNDLVPVGRDLKIPPIDGVLYEVQEEDTLESIASSFSANAQRILSFNDAEAKGISKGDEIVIPGGVKTETVLSSNSVAVSESGVSNTQVNSSQVQPVVNSYNPAYGSYNGYAFGNCTWHAANRRTQVGKPIPNNLGNAATWASLGAQSGFAVSGQPETHDVIWHKNIWANGGYGHVAFVEAINPDGSILVSDMNFYDGKGGGFNRVSNRTVSQSEFGNYLFIH